MWATAYSSRKTSRRFRRKPRKRSAARPHWLKQVPQRHRPGRRPCRRARHPRIQHRAVGPPRHRGARIPDRAGRHRQAASPPSPMARNAPPRCATPNSAGRRTAVPSPSSPVVRNSNRPLALMLAAAHSLNFTAIAVPVGSHARRPVQGPGPMVSDMKKFLRSAAAVALLGIGLITPALAQSASEMAVRMQQLEEQVRMLMGQVEELNFEVEAVARAGGRQPSRARPSRCSRRPSRSRLRRRRPKAWRSKRCRRLPASSRWKPPNSLNNTEALIVAAGFRRGPWADHSGWHRQFRGQGEGRRLRRRGSGPALAAGAGR